MSESIILNLDGKWRLRDFTPGQGMAAGAHLPDHDDADWHPASVPGDVHTALVEIGRLAPPFYNMNAETCQWVEGQEWWYRTTFEAPSGQDDAQARYLLTFDGLDTLATVYLDGAEIGRHRNMFIAATFDVTEHLRLGERNTLAVRFDPVVASVAGREIKGQWGQNPERVWVRKAQCNFGWDWAPRLVSVGIWQGVTLRRYTGARLSGVFFKTTAISPQAAEATVVVEAEQWADVPMEAQISLSRGEQQLTKQAPLTNGRAQVAFTIPDPALWWTHDLGEPALYELEAALQAGGKTLDTHCEQVGIRTIQVDQSPDPEEPGSKFFTFVLNGVKLFAKGANWIPADSFVAQVDEARYRDLLELAVEANVNMLRIWGGGIYEKDAFYRLCDELGILIWQDFMFACALYPDSDPDFMAEVEREAEAVVRRLRNHPCLAIWCGNNENDWIDDMVNWQRPGRDSPGKRIYHELLPPIVQRLDGTRLYWPSSPYGGNDHNDEREGDRHNWQVWHGAVYPRRFGEMPRRDISPAGISYRHYAEDPARFISEFGMHAAPALETLRRNVPATALRLGSPELLYRNKDEPKGKGDLLMLAHTDLPRSLQEYLDFSMICQAEGLKFGIEHYRRRKFHCSGALFWQWNDCWPGLSWSVLDYYLFPKAGYFYAKRAYAPVLASFKEEVGGVSLWITNDTLEDFVDTVTVFHGDFSGQKLYEEALEVRMPANASVKVRHLSFDELEIEDSRREYLAVRSRSGLFPDNRHFFVEVKDLVRPKPNLTVKITEGSDGKHQVRVATDTYAYFVKLVVPVEGTKFSDNYFDLFPGQERVIEIWNEAGRWLEENDIAVSCL
ncbi:MAG: glycoside hydrolase family 2 protein [Anaerolineae bacterium]|nr:glycoside hydrolase family 2 protein [Anaerolineae bacterium]